MFARYNIVFAMQTGRATAPVPRGLKAKHDP